MRGLRMVRAGNRAGLKDTVLVVRGGTVTAWLTVTGPPPPAGAPWSPGPPSPAGTPPPRGGAMVTVTRPACGLDALLVMSAFTVRAELARSRALCSITWAL